MHIRQLKPVVSSAFTHYAYDPASQTLYLKFTTGNTYAYPEFSNDDFAAFEKAESKGAHYAQHIRGKYEPVPVHIETDDEKKEPAVAG